MGPVLVEELGEPPEPADACARFLDAPFPLLLESALRSERLGRYSFLAADPWEVLRCGAGDAFPALERALALHRGEPRPDLPPFQGGAAGFLSYDLCHALERLPSPRYDDLALPDLCVGLYDWTLAWDHLEDRCWLISTGLPEEGRRRAERARDRADWVRRRLHGGMPPLPPPSVPGPPPGPPTHPVGELPGVWSTFSRDGFVSAVARTREYILAGDIFQANLSQRLEALA
ncbi:MAG TPA: hypothetical protein VLA62_06460, partial [Solirubrobacterales bacterium]|nr:hypothetical protein [Solirubrobacterales bacterium]